MSEQHISITVSIEEEKHTMLSRMSEAFGKSIEEIIATAVNEYIVNNEWKLAHMQNKPDKIEDDSTRSTEDSESIFDRFTKS